jgi:uncharacterized lipoprotein YmbA
MRPLALGALLILMGCSSGSPPTTYVLNTPADAVEGVAAETGRPVVELRTVSLPDYLDTTDIFVRDGSNELKSSQTGHWGERLSVGIADALIASLTRHLPAVRVTHAPLADEASRQLRVDVEAFDMRPDGHCVLTARWTVLGDDRRTVEAAERGTFVTLVPGTAEKLTDASIVSAMAAAVERLADRIANTLDRRAIRPR